MHPAPSLIFFTVLSGLGLGLIISLGFGFGPQDQGFALVACFLALAITGGGGSLSVLHLANPKNAWRAFSQWRSSWLSREACLMVATMGLFALYAAIWVFSGYRLWGLGLLAATLALSTVYATAMIYAQIKAVPTWSFTPTPALFLTLSIVGGIITCRLLQGIFGDTGEAWHVLPAIAVAAGVSIWWTTQAAGAGRTATGSSIASATGLGRQGQVRLFEGPHTGRNYLLDEMAYRIGRKRAFELRRIGAYVGFLIPLALAVIALFTSSWLLLAVLVCHIAGVMALRWLFFAEAEHVQALYYGQE
ncbi:MAG: DmsC/YnfH family molybdoenzyme membrane anchor subunit [Pseudomonadota bacterium]